MELDVVDLNAFRGSLGGVDHIRSSGLLLQKLVVDPKLALRHSTKLALHDHLPDHIRPQNSASVGQEYVDVLNNVNEQLVIAVLDALCSPTDGARSLDCDLPQLFDVSLLRSHVSLSDVLLQ